MADRRTAALALTRTVLRPVIDFALPPRCPGCGAITGEPHRFCLDCWARLEFLGDPCCFRCGLPFGFGPGGEEQCGACLADPPAFDRMSRYPSPPDPHALAVQIMSDHGGWPMTVFLTPDGRPFYGGT